MASLPPKELRQSLRIRLLTDSRSGLQLLQRGPAGQSMKLASDVWRLLLKMGDAGATINMQWVPGLAGIDGNEAADLLANEASSCDQAAAPVDLSSARGAIRRQATELARARMEAAHPCPTPIPGHDALPRWEAVTLSQLRTGYSPLSRDTLFRVGVARDDRCPACHEPDSVGHLLTECPAYAGSLPAVGTGPVAGGGPERPHTDNNGLHPWDWARRTAGRRAAADGPLGAPKWLARRERRGSFPPQTLPSGAMAIWLYIN